MSEDRAPGWRRLQPLLVWLSGILAAVLAAVVLAWLGIWGIVPHTDPPATGGPGGLPFTVTVEDLTSDCTGWVVPASRGAFSDPPDENADGWIRWAVQNQAVTAQYAPVRITVQGRSAAQVTLTDMRVTVMDRLPNLVGTRVGSACGGPAVYRYLRAVLDSDPPEMFPEIDDAAAVPTSGPMSLIQFPYRVSLSDAEIFIVEAESTTCHCQWVVELSWATEGRTGKLVIDNHGRPFETTGVTAITGSCFRSGSEPLVCSEAEPG